MQKIFTMGICAVLSCAILFLTACNTPPKTVAYKTLRITADAVDNAMKAAAEAKVKGVMDDVAWMKVAVLHDQYRVALDQAVKAARFDYQTATPAEVAGLAAELTTLITSYVH